MFTGNNITSFDLIKNMVDNDLYFTVRIYKEIKLNLNNKRNKKDNLIKIKNLSHPNRICFLKRNKTLQV